jgi:hypothetical protein
MDAVRSYRAYLLSASDHIRSVMTVLSAIDDAAVCLEAEALLRHSSYAAVEVWDESRLVCHIEMAQRVA